MSDVWQGEFAPGDRVMYDGADYKVFIAEDGDLGTIVAHNDTFFTMDVYEVEFDRTHPESGNRVNQYVEARNLRKV